mmetsp:Transcript_36820/g.49306  ORF Transcript_36820/g.49306 Transcript_36820/m.49306 type:complete len:249 (-) Transcript_36820:118-864(-)
MLEGQWKNKNGIDFYRVPTNVQKFQGGDSFKFDGDCTFTFVRDPLLKFMSAYFTINFYIAEMGRQKRESWQEQYNAIIKNYAFWNITTEPARFRTFVYDMINSTNEFLSVRPMDHAYTISGNMSPFFGSKIHFIGRVEQLSEHWEILSKLDHCQDAIRGRETSNHELSFGYLANEFQNHEVTEMLGLTGMDSRTSQKSEFPQYKELIRDQQLLNDIVEHLWQDYVCFGYEPKYPKLGFEYSGKFQMPY